MMNDVWQKIHERSNELSQELSSTAVDPKNRHLLQKEYSQLCSLLEKKAVIVTLEKQVAEVTALQHEEQDPMMKELYAEELQQLNCKIVEAQEILDLQMYPPNPYDQQSVFLEIRAGTGGQEAALFAGDLLQLYMAYALSKGWKAAITDISETDLKGVREVTLHIEGKNVYGHLKFESGVHRVQRVPKTESAGRIHTSTATVAVLPEMDEVEIDINPTDLRIDVYRSGGAGGQHVNTTDSAVRITHIPTGVVVACQDERSQHKNKAKAMKMLQARILTAQQAKQQAEMSEARKELVGRGMRAEKVRTYNYPQNRITDHQIDLTLKNLDVIMTGDLDPIVTAIIKHDQDERRKKPFSLEVATK